MMYLLQPQEYGIASLATSLLAAVTLLAPFTMSDVLFARPTEVDRLIDGERNAFVCGGYGTEYRGAYHDCIVGIDSLGTASYHRRMRGDGVTTFGRSHALRTTDVAKITVASQIACNS